jgi:long-chain fatty acid transport protein
MPSRTAGCGRSAAVATASLSKSQRSPVLPMADQFRVGTGVQYSINANVTVGAVYEYMNGGDSNIDVQRGPLAGKRI